MFAILYSLLLGDGGLGLACGTYGAGSEPGFSLGRALRPLHSRLLHPNVKVFSKLNSDVRSASINDIKHFRLYNQEQAKSFDDKPPIKSFGLSRLTMILFHF